MFCAIGSPRRSGSTEMRVSSYSSRTPASRSDSPGSAAPPMVNQNGSFGVMRIPAVQQQHASLGVDRQHPGGLPVPDGSRSSGDNTAHGYSTILLIGISRMSWAPAAFRAGISVLTPRLGTTVSTAFMFPRASAVIVGEDSAGSISVTAAR